MCFDTTENRLWFQNIWSAIGNIWPWELKLCHKTSRRLWRQTWDKLNVFLHFLSDAEQKSSGRCRVVSWCQSHLWLSQSDSSIQIHLHPAVFSLSPMQLLDHNGFSSMPDFLALCFGLIPQFVLGLFLTCLSCPSPAYPPGSRSVFAPCLLLFLTCIFVCRAYRYSEFSI